jgi:hypothetical protein
VNLGIGRDSIVLPKLPDSPPLHQIEFVLRSQLITVPIVNHENDQHPANENVRLRNLFHGIQVYAAILTWRGAVSQDSWMPCP